MTDSYCVVRIASPDCPLPNCFLPPAYCFPPYANSSIIAANLLQGMRFRSCRFPPYQRSEPLPIIIVPIFSLSAYIAKSRDDPARVNSTTCRFALTECFFMSFFFGIGLFLCPLPSRNYLQEVFDGFHGSKYPMLYSVSTRSAQYRGFRC